MVFFYKINYLADHTLGTTALDSLHQATEIYRHEHHSELNTKQQHKCA